MIMSILRNIAIKTLLSVSLLLATTSCLDKIPGGAIQQEDAMQTFSDAEQTVTGIYNALMSGSLWSGDLVLCSDIQADLVYAVDGYTNTYGDIWQWDILPTSDEITGVYASLYEVVSRCNLYLDKVEELRSRLVDDALIETLDRYTGEVYCARALAYSELIKCFCKAYDPTTADKELGVVIRKHYFTAEENPRRASLKESYEYVIEDLERADQLLDDSGDTFDNDYLSEAAVYALRARVALYMQDWQTAIDSSTHLIESRNFALADVNRTINGMTYFQYMWAYDSSYESIWQLRYTLTSIGGALGSVFLHITTDYTNFYPDYVPAEWVLQLYSAGDLRYNAYFAELTTGYAHGLTWPLLVKYFGNLNFIDNVIYEVSMPKPFRLAEQYLIRAEAYCNLPTPDYAKATADLNTLRDCRFSSGGAVNLTAENWLQTISDERVRELYMEGFRLHDLKRWHKGFERKQQTSTLIEGSSLKVEADDALFVWPIPQHELQAPGSEVEPNESNN